MFSSCSGLFKVSLVLRVAILKRFCFVFLSKGIGWIRFPLPSQCPETPRRSVLFSGGCGSLLVHRLKPGLWRRCCLSLFPSDGIHSVTAICTLRVTIITDDMLTNSITVRLENMSQERFLSPLLSLFVEGVATVLSTAKDGIFVFNIQNDTDVSSNILNVTFSALLPGGIRNKFFPSEDLQEQIYLNRTLLTMISTQRVLPFDDNICLREPCENYMKCVSVLKFDSSAPFISSNTVLFRPIHPINGLRCRCPPGFTGDYCETEIDLCYSNPCGNNGLCRSREGGYTCECYEDYTGMCLSYLWPMIYMLDHQPGQLCVKLKLLTFLVKGRKTPSACECHTSLRVSPVSPCTHGGKNHPLLQAVQGGCQLLKQFLWCEFLLKTLYANVLLLSGRKKVGHIPWFMVLHINSVLAP